MPLVPVYMHEIFSRFSLQDTTGDLATIPLMCVTGHGRGRTTVDYYL